MGLSDSILSLILDQNMNVTFKDNLNQLNQHSVSRQYIEVRPKGFTLSEDEALYVSFQITYTSHGATKTKNINPIQLAPIAEEGGTLYRTEVPYDVLSIRGTWTGNLSVRSDWVNVTDEEGTLVTDEEGNAVQAARRVLTSKDFTFTEYSALDPLGINVPTNADFANMYRETTESLDKAQKSAAKAQEAVTNVTNIINTAKVGFTYDEENEELTLTVFTDTEA